jgi:curli biogenesis system outer membrane secretion channel CsgG
MMLGVSTLALALACAQVNPNASPSQVATPASSPAAEAAPALRLDSQLDHLVAQISAEMSGTQKTSIAVIPFFDLDGNVNELGNLLSEELITRLYRTGKFNVIERQMLDRILTEQKLQASGLIDEDSARKLGRLLGVEALVSGSVSDLSDHIKINARVISTETGQIIGVASVRVLKDETLNRLAAAAPGSHDADLVGTFSPWMEGERFGREMKGHWGAKYFPGKVEGRLRNGVPEFRATLNPFPKGPWQFFWWFGIPRTQYETKRAELLAKGFKETSLQVFSGADGMPCYQTCWFKAFQP